MKIGERGQVTIPKKMREKYGLLPQIEIEFVEEKCVILLTKMVRHKSPVDKVYGILNDRLEYNQLLVQKVKQLNLVDRVIFCGVKDNIYAEYAATLFCTSFIKLRQ